MITEQRSTEIKELRGKLDEYIPLLKVIMDKNPGYKNDAEYQKMVKEIDDIQIQLKSDVNSESNSIDASVRGDAAVLNA